VAQAPARTPFAQALHAAWRYHTRAQQAANSAREALEAWDPNATDPLLPGIVDAETWRLEQMAQDRTGDLLRARVQARRAQTLARTSDEAYRAAESLVLIEHESDHHKEEFRQAQTLVALQPNNATSLMLLRRAAGCTRQKCFTPSRR